MARKPSVQLKAAGCGFDCTPDSGNHSKKIGFSGSVAAWALIGIALLEHMMRKHEGMKFKHPRHKERKNRRAGDTFVDCARLGITDDRPGGSMHTESLQDMTKMGQSWERVSFGSRGRPKLPKCFCVLVHWTWEQGMPRQAKTEETPGEATLKSGADRSDAVMPRPEADQPCQTVGAHTAGNGSNKTFVEKKEKDTKMHNGRTNVLKGKVEEIRARMSKMNVMEHEAAMAPDLCSLPALRCVVLASMLDEKEMTNVGAQLCKRMLLKMGARATASREM